MGVNVLVRSLFSLTIALLTGGIGLAALIDGVKHKEYFPQIPLGLGLFCFGATMIATLW